MYQSIRRLKPLTFAVQVWDESGAYIRGVVGYKDRLDFEKTVRETFDAPQYIAYFLVPDANDLAKQLPGIQRKVKNPVTLQEEQLFSVIINLNDNHKWTREQIADWIETLDDPPKFEV